MDCYYHEAVPPVAACVGCRQPICATCRGTSGDCPGCRLGARIDAATPAAELPGGRRAPAPPRRSAAVSVAARPAPAELRALVALGYPFWPLALLALLDGSKSPFIRRHALGALGFNFGMYGLWLALSAISAIPLLGISAWPLLALMIPVAFIASCVYAVRAWSGDEVRIPIVSEFIDRRRSAYD